MLQFSSIFKKLVKPTLFSLKLDALIRQNSNLSENEIDSINFEENTWKLEAFLKN